MIVKFAVAADVDVPVMAPVAAFSDRPAGRLPRDTEYVIAPVPPDAVTDWLYATPCVVAGSVAGAMLSAAAMVIVYERAPVEPSESVAPTEKVNAPAALGVPAIAPVAVFNVSPVGNVPLGAYVYGPVPPDAVTAWLYASPCVQFGKLAGFTFSVTAPTVNEYATEAVAPSVSVAVIVKS